MREAKGKPMTGDFPRIIYRGPETGLTVYYDPGEEGGEVSFHSGEHEQERMILSLDGWRELCEAARLLGPDGITSAPDVRQL